MAKSSRQDEVTGGEKSAFFRETVRALVEEGAEVGRREGEHVRRICKRRCAAAERAAVP